MPDERLLTDMGKFNEELVKAGVMLAGEGLHPSSKGARVKFSGSTRTVIDGPFTETKELIAGFWLWQVKSRDEAIEWVKRMRHPMPGTETEVELRQVFEAEDFGDALTPKLRDQEQRQLASSPARRPDGRRISTSVSRLPTYPPTDLPTYRPTLSFAHRGSTGLVPPRTDTARRSRKGRRARRH